MKARNPKKKFRRIIRDYDRTDTSKLIDPSRPLTLEEIGLRLPDAPPTQVISIRLPSRLLNELKSISSERDVPYQALIKLLLSESVSRYKRRSSS